MGEDGGGFALISLEQIKEFERSKAARDAICLLGKLSGAHNIDISQGQYTLLRDFLIVEISIDNANRSGNMKMGEFKKMKTEGDDSVILVKDHKTLYSHGHARIVLSQKMSVVTNLCHRSSLPRFRRHK